ncbi:MAG TPA: CDP-alcohol phosphatidyltransferase family protein [Candidatus Acidoferrales bacterium]|nr:CDP-alcohol phosphatidyltransferase family protein [Candidatus Acidoferrales bacterium]
MTPNQVTLARVAAAFTAAALFTLGADAPAADLAAVFLTIAAIALDGVDGYLARTRGLATPLGAQIDILGDRVVENLFFTLFAVSGLISLWVPVLFFVRGSLTDFLRGLAARTGRSGFGQHAMLETWWGRSLVASRASRAAYAALKCVCFCCLGVLLPLQHLSTAQVHAWFGEVAASSFVNGARALTGATVIFCLVRTIPVIWEGRRYFAAVQNTPARVAIEVTR